MADTTEKFEWWERAKKIQKNYFDTLGSRPYDEIEKENLFLLKKKVGFATCGEPSESPNLSNYNLGYKKENLDLITQVCNKILEQSSFDPVHFACTMLVLDDNGKEAVTPVFRIATEGGSIFIDCSCRVYASWEKFMENNTLPSCTYCYPENGKYDITKGFEVKTAESPASSLLSKTCGVLDTAGAVASIGAAGVLAAGTVITVAPVAVAGATVAAATTGVYAATRSAQTLYDRNEHSQSIGLRDAESRGAWLNLGASVVGVATAGLVSKAQKLVESGKALSKWSTVGLHTLNATSLIFSGFGFVDACINCTDRYQKGVLSKQDVFLLTSELLFLVSAVASTVATNKLITQMSVVVESPGMPKNLTKSQKRNFRRRAAKRRAKGLSTGVIQERENGNPSVVVAPGLFNIALKTVNGFDFRCAEICYKFQSIGHDVCCWLNGEITLPTLIGKMSPKLYDVYKFFKEEIDEALTKLVNYFIEFNIQEIIPQLFETSAIEFQNELLVQIINTEDQLEKKLHEAEEEIRVVYETLEIESEEFDSSNGNTVEDGSSLGDGFSPETIQLLKCTESLIQGSSITCESLTDYGEAIERMKNAILKEFQLKLSDYKKCLETVKALSGSSFDIKKFNEMLKISEVDISQYFYSQAIQNVTNSNDPGLICSINTAERHRKFTPVWIELIEGVYTYCMPQGVQDPELELLNVTREILGNELAENDYECNKVEDMIIIKVKSNESKDLVVIATCKTIEDCTNGLIYIVK